MKKDSISTIFLIFLAVYSFAQDDIKIKQNSEVFHITSEYQNKIIDTDSIMFFHPMKYYKWKRALDGSVYFSWVFIALGNKKVYHLRRYYLDNNKNIVIDKVHWCKQDFFEKKLKEKNCIELCTIGIEILFEDESVKPIKVKYKKLKKHLLHDFLVKKE